MKILILSKYHEEGASSRYRYYNYKKYFLKENIDIKYEPLLYDGYVKNYYEHKKNSKIKMILSIFKRVIFILKNKNKFDHIIIEKELVSYLPFFIEKFLLKEKNYSLDFDDNPKAPYEGNRLINKIFGNKIENLCRGASFVTVGNRWYFKEFKTGNLVYLPTVIDLDKYTSIKKDYASEEKSLVWIGSKSTLKYLKIIESVLRKLSKKYNIKLKIIGGKIKLKGIKVEYIPWSDETEVEEISKGDIGIMPLYDTYWENGKCGFKLIQYMACGLPVIASQAPANEEIIIHEENGYIARTEEEWYEYLEKMILDSDLRKKMGTAGRKRVEKKYSYQVWGLEYAKFIKGVKK